MNIHLYCLVNPKEPLRPFYIGITRKRLPKTDESLKRNLASYSAMVNASYGLEQN